MEKGLGKETKRFRLSIISGLLAWMVADVQMNHGSSAAHTQWFSHLNIRADNHDIII